MGVVVKRFEVYRIHPLGNPTRQLRAQDARQEWPILRSVGRGGVPAALNITGVTVFVPTKISSDDWARILNDLSVMY